jgi:hypothetical protein
LDQTGEAQVGGPWVVENLQVAGCELVSFPQRVFFPELWWIRAAPQNTLMVIRGQEQSYNILQFLSNNLSAITQLSKVSLRGDPNINWLENYAPLL